jgi:hypothetical protein
MKTWDTATVSDEVAGIAENALAISTLASQVSLALRKAESIFIWELSEKSDSVGRAVVQFRVTVELFESFFNSSAGYRAMFRRGPRIGSATNAAIVASLNKLLLDSMPETVTAHQVEVGPKWIGRTKIPKSMFLRSLDPSLAKVWYSTAELRPNGEVRLMPTGVSDGKIDVGLAHDWKEIRQNPEDCILEAKGAFVGPCGLFQRKDPELRALTLFTKGQA